MKTCEDCRTQIFIGGLCPECRKKRAKKSARQAVLLRQMKSYSAKLARIETELQNYEAKS